MLTICLIFSLTCWSAQAWVVQSVRARVPTPQIVIDGGYQDGLLVGTLLEVTAYESLASSDATSTRQREIFVAKALVTEANTDWCLAEGIGAPVEPFAEGQLVRMKAENTVRYVTASQTHILIDLNAAAAQSTQQGDILQVLRPMEFPHPVTQEPVHMLDAIGTVQVIRTTPHRFTARAVSLDTVKPILASDIVRPIKQLDTSVHVLRILEDGVYLNRYDGAAAGQRALLTRNFVPTDTRIEFRVRAVYPHLVEVECSQTGDIEAGESITVEVQTGESADAQ